VESDDKHESHGVVRGAL